MHRIHYFILFSGKSTEKVHDSKISPSMHNNLGSPSPNMKVIHEYVPPLDLNLDRYMPALCHSNSTDFAKDANGSHSFCNVVLRTCQKSAKDASQPDDT